MASDKCISPVVLCKATAIVAQQRMLGKRLLLRVTAIALVQAHLPSRPTAQVVRQPRGERDDSVVSSELYWHVVQCLLQFWCHGHGVPTIGFSVYWDAQGRCRT